MFRGRRPAALDRPCRFGRGFRNGRYRRFSVTQRLHLERLFLPQNPTFRVVPKIGSMGWAINCRCSR
jgi:hypothetical protein